MISMAMTIDYFDEEKDENIKQSREDWEFNPDFGAPRKVALFDTSKSREDTAGKVFAIDDLITKAMDENGIPYDENTLGNLSTRDVYDILAGRYDPNVKKLTLKALDFKGKNIVLSGIRKVESQNYFRAAVKWLGGVEQDEVGPDTDFVVYNEDEGKGGKREKHIDLLWN